MDDASYFQAIPKAELHLHLDGSVRPQTVLELAKQGGVLLPTQDVGKLRDFLEATDRTASLVEYIAYFELPIAVLQTVPALERATYELCEDLKNDNVRYAEIRYGPWLHVQQGLSLTDVIRAVLSGWTAGKKAFGLEGGVIVTALRDMPPAQNVSLAQIAGRYVGEGVVGFDLAGDEAGHPPILHEDAFRVARSLGLNITIHAGEAAGPESVRQAISMGAVRLGHGVRAQEDAEVIAMIKENGVQLDMAPTSNAQTKAVQRLEDHPLRRFYEQGIKVTISTDSRTVSNVTLTQEYQTVSHALGCSPEEISAMNLQALDGGFGDEVTRAPLRREFVDAMAKLRPATPTSG
ncbi:MAG TPA: adenosine deaminase [Candidatus Dormibacteraeota bacterium]|nr:adenosine deaminase [Candidatus Dormibacteraeota bacterium]